ncbi:UvrD/REP helicase [Clavibacter michiganensis subsp. michiganensis]|uniref:AAA family ATPase n=1 Tax=Clavibacter michiganensis TaxID=28447 RepID=UPI000A3BC545|nr:AAA family ATPase [Clavibacter michiganensis]KAF0259788.1 UvrD/REP helicase [Clavibacter michiganensis subsp. michiganensis]OUD95452.1 UvrD/REP helicase [Clavibacter michiganensis subsp. michiganensis]OUE10782.1 UvrD/REP helicase [Clavibacter michiganensis subsp. michiganensis]OUE12545.1 UvrD/REP helicase [Clavibacter michiganensis subsp. michiganensis]
MPAEVLFAVAGSGKTTAIASRIAAQDIAATSVAITFTLRGQAEIVSRLTSVGHARHETMGWYAFLVTHIVKPYLPAVFADVKANGLHFVDSDYDIPRYRSGWRYYFDDSHKPYSSRLSVLCKKILQDTGNAAVRRLEDIYDHVYIDELQDLAGNDLFIVDALMTSSICLYMTGDARQTVLTTSRSDKFLGAYRGVAAVEWYRRQEDAGKCKVLYAETSRRFVAPIAQFSDLIHDPGLALPSTRSLYESDANHQGVFLVEESDLHNYVKMWQPTILYSKSSAKTYPQAELLTFGTAKGITRERVAIMTTDPIRQWLISRAKLKDRSAAGFYVAATRARCSVALVVPNVKSILPQMHAEFRDLVKIWANA